MINRKPLKHATLLFDTVPVYFALPLDVDYGCLQAEILANGKLTRIDFCHTADFPTTFEVLGTLGMTWYSFAALQGAGTILNQHAAPGLCDAMEKWPPRRERLLAGRAPLGGSGTVRGVMRTAPKAATFLRSVDKRIASSLRSDHRSSVRFRCSSASSAL